MEMEALVNLLSDCFVWHAIGWDKCFVIAERASASPQLSVTVWTAVANVEGEFQHGAAEDASAVVVI